MRPISFVAAGVSLCAGFASASFQDTSPFIFFSTSEVLQSSSVYSTADAISTTLESSLSKCMTDIYFLAHQPGVSSNDYDADNSCHGCLQQKYLSAKNRDIRSSFTVAQVRGQLKPATFRDTLISACGASTTSLDAASGMVVGSTDAANVTKPRVVSVSLPPLSGAPGSAERKQAEHENERRLGDIIAAHGGKSFSVIYTTTPISSVQVSEGLEYEMDNHQVPLNMELKRDLTGLESRAPVINGTSPNAPLFEKYQYFTPALFQGLGVGIFLAVILYVAISAIAGLTPTYAAFDKESGPQSQKKQQ